MKYQPFRNPRPFLLVFDKYDDVIPMLRKFAKEQGIRGGRFAALGAFEKAVIAYWNPEIRDYEHIEVNEQVEVLSMLGDIAIADEQTRVHAHVVLGKRDGSAVGGHLLEARVYPTLEMHLVDYGAALERKQDEETKLALISLREER
jgi:predicted DNA-binding protein with PD1-like motif